MLYVNVLKLNETKLGLELVTACDLLFTLRRPTGFELGSLGSRTRFQPKPTTEPPSRLNMEKKSESLKTMLVNFLFKSKIATYPQFFQKLEFFLILRV